MKIKFLIRRFRNFLVLLLTGIPILFKRNKATFHKKFPSAPQSTLNQL